MTNRNKQDAITGAGYLAIAAIGSVAIAYTLGTKLDRDVAVATAKQAVAISESCNRLQAIPGAVVVVRDGIGRDLMGQPMPIDAACWAKGSDGHWRQTNAIAGPLADLYPKRLVEALGK